MGKIATGHFAASGKMLFEGDRVTVDGVPGIIMWLDGRWAFYKNGTAEPLNKWGKTPYFWCNNRCNNRCNNAATTKYCCRADCNNANIVAVLLQ